MGASKTQTTQVISIPVVYGLNLTPGVLFVISFNGASTSPTIFSSVTGGVGPFEYLWTIDNNSITINSQTSAKTTFSASGFNEEFSGEAKLTVTDTGNGNAEISKTAQVTFTFETFI